MCTDTRLCLECQRCVLDAAQPGYSEWTPGTGLELRCQVARWTFDPYAADKGQLAGWLRQAACCPDFVAVGTACAACGGALDRTTYTTCVDCGATRKAEG
jgi:hypothetical protein